MRAAVVLLLVLHLVEHAPAGGLKPEESLEMFTAADGFEVELFASEPEIRQPVTMLFDSRGRLWTIQYLQYPTPAGLQPVAVDRYLRTRYDRVPEPPPGGPRGADRITIAEDSDGDGRADRFKDFVGGLNLASGLALGHGGVFVLQAPYLLFYPDQNSDDVPDSDPEVLLTGFGLEDAHAVGNSLQFGPDGWLYGAQGSTVTANIRGIEFQQGIWRYHPRTKAFELFAEGGGNTWGVDFDRHGQLIAGTNFGGVAALHQVQGAYYVKNFGKHGALHNPYTFGYFEHLPYREPQHILGGEHVMCGGVLYEGGAFPTAFNHRYITCALLHRAIYWHDIQPSGSSFTTGWGGKLLTTDDQWFRPVDLTIGPDGAIYIADWYDIRANHVDPNDTWDRSNGRIYRLAPAGLPRANVENLNELASSELVQLLEHPNVWYRRQAREILSGRRDGTTYGELRHMVHNARTESTVTALEPLWTLYASGGWSDEFALKELAHPNEHVRAWTVRLIGNNPTVTPQIAKRLTELAAAERSAVVRNQLACTAKRLQAETALPILQALLRYDEDLGDPQIPLLLWWALESQVGNALQDVVDLFDAPEFWHLPMVKQVIVRRLARRLAAGGAAELAAAAKLLRTAPTGELAELVVTGMEEQLANRLLPDAPPELAGAIHELSQQDEPTPELVRLAARIGDEAALKRVDAAVHDRSLQPNERVEMIALLGLTRRGDCIPVLLDFIETEQDPTLQSAAIGVLQGFDDNHIAARLLEVYHGASATTRGRIRDALLNRPAWTTALFEQIDRGKINSRDVSVADVQRGLLHSESQESIIAKLARKHWGSLRSSTSGEITARIAAVANELQRGTGSVERGKPLFTKHCSTCHVLHGEGARIGPDLTGADRGNQAFLLQNIINPAGQVREEYISYTALTDDGRVLVGLIAESTPETVTLLSAANERTTIERDSIEQLNQSDTSLMPEKLLDVLSGQEIRDLMAYLQSNPATPH